jgi:hypothetical protein
MAHEISSSIQANTFIFVHPDVQQHSHCEIDALIGTRFHFESYHCIFSMMSYLHHCWLVKGLKEESAQLAPTLHQRCSVEKV